MVKGNLRFWLSENSIIFVTLKLDLYQTMVLLQDNEAMRHFIENHTEQNTTIAQWKEAIKTSFGLTYYKVIAQWIKSKLENGIQKKSKFVV